MIRPEHSCLGWPRSDAGRRPACSAVYRRFSSAVLLPQHRLQHLARSVAAQRHMSLFCVINGDAKYLIRMTCILEQINKGLVLPREYASLTHLLGPPYVYGRRIMQAAIFNVTTEVSFFSPPPRNQVVSWSGAGTPLNSLIFGTGKGTGPPKSSF